MMIRRIISIIYLVIHISLLIIPLSAKSEDSIYQFAPQGDYCIFRANDAEGILDETGQVVVPAQYTRIEPIIDGYCVVWSGEKCGLWDVNRACQILPCEYTWIQWCDGMIRADFHIVNPQTAEVVELGHDYSVYVYDSEAKLFIVESFEEPWYGIVNLEGEVVFEQFEEMPGPGGLSLSEDGIITFVNTDDKIRFFDTNHQRFIGESYISALSFHNGYAAVMQNYPQWFLIDHTGQQVTPLLHNVAYNLLDETAVSSNGWVLCDCGDGWCLARISNLNVATFDCILPLSCSEMPSYLECNIFSWQDEDKMFIYSVNTNKCVVLQKDSVIFPFVNGAAILHTEHGYGYVYNDLSMTECCFDEATNYIDEYALVRISEVWHPINRQGHVLKEQCFYGIYRGISNGYFLIRDNEGRMQYINPDMQIVVGLSNVTVPILWFFTES